jgi:hypothetical protein
MSDLPSTAAKVFQYVEDIAVTYRAKAFEECDNNLEADIKMLNNFLIVGAFNRIQEILKCAYFTSIRMLPTNNWDEMFNGTSIKHVDHPKYLGVTLDRTLTFKSHLEKAAKKVSSRVNLVR